MSFVLLVLESDLFVLCAFHPRRRQIEAQIRRAIHIRHGRSGVSTPSFHGGPGDQHRKLPPPAAVFQRGSAIFFITASACLRLSCRSPTHAVALDDVEARRGRSRNGVRQQIVNQKRALSWASSFVDTSEFMSASAILAA